MKTSKIKSVKLLLALPIIIVSAYFSAGCILNINSTLDKPLDNQIIPSNDSYSIGNAISYKNLQVFPIGGVEIENEIVYITLTEAMENNKVIVQETSSVNRLSVDNKTGDYIFILAGDIVKGGRQDRTMGNDVIIGPQTKNIPLESYCVESGRWSQRGNEESNRFSGNTKMLASKELKLASRYEKNQSSVWQRVSEKQDKLNENLSEMKGENVEVRSDQSGTSLQLTLESQDLEEIVRDYKDNLDDLYRLPDNTLGFAYAINGEIYGIDIFGSNKLFKELQNKLFEAVIVEAISEYDKNLVVKNLGSDLVERLISQLQTENKQQTEVNDQTEVYITELQDGVWFETIHTGNVQQWIHRNFIARD